MAAQLRVQYVKSSISHPKDQKATIRLLGLRRLNQTVTLPDNSAVRGMVRKVAHLVRIEEVTEEA